MGLDKSVFYNICLRGSMMLSKFLFIFAAAKYLTLDDLGTYGLVCAAVFYGLYLLGMDFYTFATREIVGSTYLEQSRIILDQFRFYLLSFFVYFIPFLGIFWFGLLNWELALIFYLLLFFEHLSQEMSRLIIVMEKPLQASFILFVRTSSWAYLVAFAFFIDPVFRSVEFILYVWTFSSAVSVLLGLFTLRFVPWSRMFSQSIQLHWFAKGLKISLPFLVSTLAIRSVFTLDRYTIEWSDGLAMVGIYTVYIGLCSSMLSFIDAAVFQFNYPKMVRQAKKFNKSGFLRLIKSSTLLVVGCLVFSIVAFVLAVEVVLDFLGKDEYLSYLEVFWWLLCAHVFLVLSYLPHFGLYALNEDRWILKSQVICLFVFVCMLLSIDSGERMLDVAISMTLSFFCCFIVKIVAFYKSYFVFSEKAEGF